MPASCARMIGPLAVVLFLASAVSADAQDNRPIGGNPPPNVEIGTVISGLFTSGSLLGLGLRVTGGNGGRFSVEGGLDWTDALNTHYDSEQVIWFFFWQVKQTLWSDGTSSSLFATYGTAGFTGRTTVSPGHLDTWLLPPILPMVGIGWQQVVGDGQLVVGPFEGGNAVPRITVGVSIPIGGYRH
jgi:hypothetical protein